MSPQIQWLGDIEKGGPGGYVAKALSEGIGGFVKGYTYGREKATEKAMKEKEIGISQSELDLKTKQLENDYAKLDYDKRKDTYDTMVKLLPSVPPEKQTELLSSPEWTTLEKSLGLPSLSGSTLSPEVPKPSWGQTQETASIKADLTRGQGSISTLVGEPLPVDIKTEEDAFNYISKKGRDPSEFATELSRYRTANPTMSTKTKGRQVSPYKEYPDAYLEGGKWKVKRGGKVYKIEE